MTTHQTLRVQRVYGDSRVATAVATSRMVFPDGADTVVLAAAQRFPDALAAVPLAVREQASLLLVEQQIDAQLREEITRLGASRAILIGAHGAVPVVVALQLEQAGLAVTRFAGDGRFHTAARVATHLGPGPQPDLEVLIASGETFTDALPAGPLAALAGIPVLLTAAAVLPPDAATTLAEFATRRTLVVGGRDAVSDAVLDALPGPRRIAGNSRYATSVAVARELVARGGRLDTVVLATARDFADALAGGPLAAQMQGPLLLVDGHDASAADEVFQFLSDQAAAISRVVLVGGPEALTEAVEARVNAALEGRP